MLKKPSVKHLLILATALIGIDLLFSLLTTCDPIGHYGSAKQTYEKECTALSGPIIRNVLIFLTWVGHILHEFDKEIVALFTAILTLSTIALWWTTRNLFQAGERQSLISERALDAADRPWVGPTGEIEPHFVVGEKGKITVGLKNFGKSPARHLRIVAHVHSGSPALPAPPPITEDHMKKSDSREVRFPGETFFTTWEGPIIKNGDWENILSGRRTLWIQGRLEYFGQTGPKRTTSFRYRYSFSEGVVIQTEDGNEVT
jgi:hypothetical protein